MDQIDDQITIEQLAGGNEQKRRALELTADYERRFGVPVPIMYMPDDDAEYAEMLEAALKSGKPIDVEAIERKALKSGYIL